MDVLEGGSVKEVSIMTNLMYASCNGVGNLPRLTFRCSVGN
jgi:hypothetical protein